MSEAFLVTGANGDIGDAIGRILRQSYPDAVLHGTEISEPWPACTLFDRVHRVPRADDPAYPAALRRLADRFGYTVIIPCSEPELARLLDEPADSCLPLLVGDRELVAVFLDKLDTARWLVANGLAAPRTMPLAEASASHLPLLVKPRRGWGGRGHEVIRTPARLALAQAEADDGMVAQEFLPDAGAEFTCALFGHGGEVRSITLRRTLNGTMTGRAVVESLPEIETLLAGIAAAARLEGAINVQLRLTAAGPMVFEINPRFSSTVMMRHLIGFSDVVWAVEAFRRGTPPPQYQPQLGTLLFRASREIVVPAPAPGDEW